MMDATIFPFMTDVILDMREVRQKNDERIRALFQEWDDSKKMPRKKKEIYEKENLVRIFNLQLC